MTNSTEVLQDWVKPCIGFLSLYLDCFVESIICYVLLFNNINNLSHYITVLRHMSSLNCCWHLRELLSQHILANTVQYEVLVTLMSSFAANCAVIEGNYRDQLADICLDTYLTPERPVYTPIIAMCPNYSHKPLLLHYNRRWHRH